MTFVKYDAREKSKFHNSYLSNSSNMNKNSKDILFATFWHVFACYQNHEPNLKTKDNVALIDVGTSEGTFNDDDWDLPISRQWMSWEFYTNGYYFVPKIKSDDVGNSINVDTFISEAITKKGSNERNTISYLAGDVGVGKTAFLNYIITDKGAKIFASDTWFLRYNVDRHNIDDELLSIESLSLGLCLKLHRVISHLEEEVPKHLDGLQIVKKTLPSSDGTYNKKPQTTDQIKNCFAKAVREVSRILNRKFTLILDNVDYVFHIDDRDSFKRDSSSNVDVSLKNTHTIVKEFLENSYILGRLSANVIICLRTESYLYLENTEKFYGPSSRYKQRLNYYVLESPLWENVISGRVKFLKRFLEKLSQIDEYKGKAKALNDEFEPFLRIVYGHIRSSSRSSNRIEILAALENLTNEGMRDFLSFFTNFAWVSTWVRGDEAADLFLRYLEQKPIALMMYIMKGKLLYSQMGSDFPNVFLVDAGGTGKSSDILEQDGNDIRVSTSHEHTYFLKYFLLEFINQRQGKATKTRDILKIFCGSNVFTTNPTDGFYSEISVRSVLGSLAERPASNAIMTTRDVSEGRTFIQSIQLTQRGKYLLEKLMWRFYYLQLVVDDPNLSIPEALWNQFKYDNKHNYRYLASGEIDFTEGSKKMVSHKIKRVVEFLAILHVEKDLELSRFNLAINELNREKIFLPDLNKVLGNIIIEVMKINRAVKLYENESDIEATLTTLFKQACDTYLEKITDG